jgi:alkylation response protein AidB-like acyl-CoA dehydrogenase
MRFTPASTTETDEELRTAVRAFLDRELPLGQYRPGLGMMGAHDPSFSRKLGEFGWLGMALPEDYGGGGHTTVERFVVVEELLARGAPIGAHWAADRQTAATIMLNGSEWQRHRFLPAIAAGECYFSLGMSEPDSGSDLASVRTTATKVDGGWVVNGTKVWTSDAHRNHFFVVLCRTSPAGDRHEGLSQLIVDLASEGVTVMPIPYLDGSHHFNEVVLQDVFVPDDMLLGEPGDGWKQVTSELVFERAGPDRLLSTYQIIERFIHEHPLDVAGPDPLVARHVGRLVAKLWAIRQMSLAVAKAVDAGAAPATEAAVVKDLGTTFEQESVEVPRNLRLTRSRPSSSCSGRGS